MFTREQDIVLWISKADDAFGLLSCICVTLGVKIIHLLYAHWCGTTIVRHFFATRSFNLEDLVQVVLEVLVAVNVSLLDVVGCISNHVFARDM